MLYNGIVLRAMGLIKGLGAKGPITSLRGPWVLHSSHGCMGPLRPSEVAPGARGPAVFNIKECLFVRLYVSPKSLYYGLGKLTDYLV